MNGIVRGLLSVSLCAGLVLPSNIAVAATAVMTTAEEGEELPDPSTLSDEEKLEWAKKLFLQAKEYHDNEDYYNSVIKYEQAYSYAPDKHIFAYNLGVDAWELKDCARVKQYLQLFLIKDEDHEDLQANARDILKDAENNPECITTAGGGTAEPDGPPTQPTQVAEDDEDAPDLSARSRDGSPSADDGPKKKGPSGMLIGGAVLTVLGVGAIGGGVGTLVVASGTASELATLSEPMETGFVQTQYDSEIQGKESTLATMNIVTPVLLGVGGAMLAGGVALIVVDSINKKKGKGHYAQKPKAKAKIAGFGAAPLPGGGAGASMTVRF